MVDRNITISVIILNENGLRLPGEIKNKNVKQPHVVYKRHAYNIGTKTG